MCMMGLVEHARGRVRAGLQAQAVPSSLPGFLDSCCLTMHDRMCSCSWNLSLIAQ